MYIGPNGYTDVYDCERTGTEAGIDGILLLFAIFHTHTHTHTHK